jgi:pantoate--beta-alanine ligase
MMKILTTIEETRKIIKEWKKQGLSVGFVPTMGYLHEGHGSLIQAAKENDKVVVSIFVNPMQFGKGEDLDAYPRDLEKDAKYCESLGVDLIFHPDATTMYTDSFYSYVDVSVLTEDLCGKSRPTHFRGVCTVVTKLFNIITPDRAYFGQKDAQQLAIIKQMVKDLNIDTQIIGCPIIREEDGLAKSSRNAYLSKEERTAAIVLSQSLEIGKTLLLNGEKQAARIQKAIIDKIHSEAQASIDYVKIVHAMTLQPVQTIENNVLVAIAVKIGKTRLIDNWVYSTTHSLDEIKGYKDIQKNVQNNMKAEERGI